MSDGHGAQDPTAIVALGQSLWNWGLGIGGLLGGAIGGLFAARGFSRPAPEPSPPAIEDDRAGDWAEMKATQEQQDRRIDDLRSDLRDLRKLVEGLGTHNDLGRLNAEMRDFRQLIIQSVLTTRAPS